MAEDVHTFIDADYLWVQYSSELDKTAFYTITTARQTRNCMFQTGDGDETLNQASRISRQRFNKVNQDGGAIVYKVCGCKLQERYSAC
ncbi:MAG: hypothetical protein ACLTDF_03610 [Coprococcus sp.]